MKIRSIFLMLSVGLSLNVSADWKIYNGSKCGTQYASDEGKVFRDSGVIKNTSSTNVHIFCPVVKDKTDEQTINHLTLYTSFTSAAHCAGGTLDSKGKTILHLTTATVQGGSNEVTSISKDTDSGDNDSSFFVTCNLTPGSALNAYKIAE